MPSKKDGSVAGMGNVKVPGFSNAPVRRKMTATENRFRFFAAVITATTVLACGRPFPEEQQTEHRFSPSARHGTAAMLLEDREARRDPSDGGGRAWLEDGEKTCVAGSTGHFSLVYEAGPLGVEEGGALYFLPSPFWGWSAAQTASPDGLGFTQASTEAEGVRLETEVVEGQFVAWIEGRKLETGEHVTVVYGAGPAGARVDRYAESRSRLWVAVDGDGDGIRKVLADSPSVRVVAGPAAQAVVTVPSVIRPGERVEARIAWLDAAGNAGTDFVGEVELDLEPAAEEFPARVAFAPEDGGQRSLEFGIAREGVYRMRLRSSGVDHGLSNPIRVSDSAVPILWADLHGHSGLSDGTGTPEDYFRYARDAAALDVVALTDHDHWGMVFLDDQSEPWREIERTVEEFNEPGRFVTLLGYEWTSWLYGHRHVLFFDGGGEVLSSIDPLFDTPSELWEALRGRRALTVAHHSAGGPVATDWSRRPDPILEPLTEIVSVHGSSEAVDSPGLIYSSVEGNFVRDVLDRGERLGFLGSGDSHDGHPGLSHLAGGLGGLTGIVAAEPDREGIWRALRERRVYATNGPRILLRFAVEGRPMGSVLEGAPEEVGVFVAVVGDGPIDRIDIVGFGRVLGSIACEGRWEVASTATIRREEPGGYLYVRVVQEDGGAAWSSPVFFSTD